MLTEGSCTDSLLEPNCQIVLMAFATASFLPSQDSMLSRATVTVYA